MRKFVAVVTVVLFILSFIEFDTFAQDDRAQHLKSEIQRHKAAIKQLKGELHGLVGVPPEDEGGYSDEGGEGPPPPPGKRPPKEGMKRPHKGPKKGLHKGPHKGKRKGEHHKKGYDGTKHGGGRRK